MAKRFPPPIANLPAAHIPLEGVSAFLSPSDSHRIIFMAFEGDITFFDEHDRCRRK
jgi:hypothetical protein